MTREQRIAAELRRMADELDPPGERARPRRRRRRVAPTADGARALEVAMQRAGIAAPGDPVS